MTKIYMSPNKCAYARGKYLLQVLVFEVQIKTSSRFPVTVDCFFVLHILINSLIMMVITRKSVERVFILIQFSLLEKTRLIVQPWCIKEDSSMGAFEWII